jgi:hypothetical protein
MHLAGYIEALQPVFGVYASLLLNEGESDERCFACLRAIVASLMNISLGSYGKLAGILSFNANKSFAMPL